MNELALFAGAGGGILAGELLGWRTVCAVECDYYCANVLAQRQNDQILQPFPIWSDVRTFDGRPWRGLVDVISGGFPCQDISVAGKGKGLAGARSGLWSEFARIIDEARPKSVFIENSPMLRTRGLITVLQDLAHLGFYARWDCVSAAQMGAHHKRDRIWIVAHANGQREQQQGGVERQVGQRSSDSRQAMVYTERKRLQARRQTDGENVRLQSSTAGQYASMLADTLCNGTRKEPASLCADACPASIGTRGRQGPEPGHEGVDVSDSHRIGCGLLEYQDSCAAQSSGQQYSAEQCSSGCQWQPSGWPAEPNVGRVAHGVAYRVDRVKAIGNGQVPRVAAAAWRLLA